MRHLLPSNGKAENENNGLSTDFLDAPIRNINVGLFGKDRVTASYKTIDISCPLGNFTSVRWPLLLQKQALWHVPSRRKPCAGSECRLSLSSPLLSNLSAAESKRGSSASDGALPRCHESSFSINLEPESALTAFCHRQKAGGASPGFKNSQSR